MVKIIKKNNYKNNFFKKKYKLKKIMFKNKLLNSSIGNAYIKTSKNNIIITVTDINNNVISWSTSYSSGFKNNKKALYLSVQNASEKCGKIAFKKGIYKINMIFKGINDSKELMIKGFYNVGIKIISIFDKTSIPYNGCRASKIRRI